jgi:hypothetical protein
MRVVHRRSLLAAMVIALLTSSALAACGGSTDDHSSGPTAVQVAETLKAQGAPIVGEIFNVPSDSFTYEGTTSMVQTNTHTLDVEIQVYDTSEHRRQASEAEHERLVNFAPNGLDTYRKVECGPIYIWTGIDLNPAMIEPQRSEFDQIKAALRSAYGPC